MGTEKKRVFIINVLFFACIFGLLYLAFKYLLLWLMPFIIGFFVALLLQRPINGLVRLTHWNKKMVSPIVTFILVAAVAVAFSALVYNASHEIAAFVIKLPGDFSASASALLNSIDELTNRIFFSMPDNLESLLRDSAQSLISAIQSWLAGFASSALGWIATFATGIPGLIVAVIICIVSCFFMSTGFSEITDFFRRQVPARYRKPIAESWNRFGKTVVSMLASYALIMFITFCELSIGFLIYGINYAVLLAAIISLVDILPVLGVGTVLIPWGVIALIVGQTGMGIKILLLYLVITIVRNFLEPKIIGQRIGLPPLVTMVFMYIGLKLMGVVGMFLLPLTVILINDAQRTGLIKIWNTSGDEAEEQPAGPGEPPPAP